MTVNATSKACPLELCLATDDPSRLQHNVQLAASLGVSRLELCADMAQDGLTPALAAVELARRHWGDQPGVMAMLRPRGGDFCYRPAEINQLLTMLPLLAAAGADAVVTGVLQRDASGQLQPHWQALADLSAAAQSAGLTFCLHRAIDACSDPLTSWQQLTRGPVAPARLLSSGCHWHSAKPGSSSGSAAVDGAVAGIQRLQQQLQLGGAELVVAGKVSAANLHWLRQQLQAVPLPAVSPHGGCSFHLYSAVLRDGWVDPALLSAVLAQCNSPVDWRPLV